MPFPIELELFASKYRQEMGEQFRVEIVITPDRKFGLVTQLDIHGKHFEVATYFPVGQSPAAYAYKILNAFARAEEKLTGKAAKDVKVKELPIEFIDMPTEGTA